MRYAICSLALIWTGMTDEALARAAETTDVFAKLTPDQKSRVVSVLRGNGHTVGFMGDGINDAAAMKSGGYRHFCRYCG